MRSIRSVETQVRGECPSGFDRNAMRMRRQESERDEFDGQRKFSEDRCAYMLRASPCQRHIETPR